MRLWCWLLLLCVGCATSEGTREARTVRVASTFGEVAGCEMLGRVESSAPHASDDDALAEMTSKAAGLGGNVLYITVIGVKPGKSGVAYRCSL
jgi:hypothetical protein